MSPPRSAEDHAQQRPADEDRDQVGERVRGVRQQSGKEEVLGLAGARDDVGREREPAQARERVLEVCPRTIRATAKTTPSAIAAITAARVSCPLTVYVTTNAAAGSADSATPSRPPTASRSEGGASEVIAAAAESRVSLTRWRLWAPREAANVHASGGYGRY